MKYTAAFIGAGNMGGALAAAVYKAAPDIAVCEQNPSRVAALRETMPSLAVADAQSASAESRFLFLGVKPDVVRAVAASVADALSPGTVVVTMAAGVPLADISAAARTERVIRIMPNTPAAVGAGMILYCTGAGVTEADEAQFLSLMRFAGVIDKIPEGKIDAAAALSGCGPAFVYIFAEALADGAVRCGLPRDKALLYAEQTIAGSAAMLLESGKHPGELKDAVCSPGGTTIEGVLAMERAGFRAAAADAVIAAYEKTAKLK